MRMRKKAPAPPPVHPSNRTTVQASPARRRRAPASQRESARPSGRRYGDRPAQTHRQPAPGQGSRPADLSAPPIPLILPAMHRTRHPRARSLARPAFLLSSVIALLAFACAPVFAQAETVYEYENPTIPGETKPVHHKGKNSPSGESSPAHSSNAPGGGGTGAGPGGGSGGHNVSGNPSTGAEGGNGQGSPGGSAGGDQSGAGGQLQAGEPAGSTSGSGGGSSPLVPILIAIAVLAAISIGAVVIRQRRQRQGGGGATVSSSKAG